MIKLLSTTVTDDFGNEVSISELSWIYANYSTGKFSGSVLSASLKYPCKE